jgi:hypothetical protein
LCRDLLTKRTRMPTIPQSANSWAHVSFDQHGRTWQLQNFGAFSYSYYKYGNNWAPKYERLLESVMVISCSIFQLHIFKTQIYANILDASPFPQTTNYMTSNKDKNNALQTQGNWC